MSSKGHTNPNMGSGNKVIPPSSPPPGTPETTPVGEDGIIPPTPPKSPPGVPAGPLDPKAQEELDKKNKPSHLPKTHIHNS